MIRKYLLYTFLLSSNFIYAQTGMNLHQAFLGKYDFTMIGNTMNEEPNGAFAYCDFLTQTSATLNLAADQTIEAAYLYWAGSGSLAQADLTIKLNGMPVTVDRTFTTDITGRGIFGAFSDVTNFVQATGNGVYTVSDFDLSGVISDYCSNGTNFGGWSILIVYEQPTLTNNLVNVYDGFVRVDQNNPTVNINLTNLNVLHLVGNKIGFLAWEGDANIDNGEQLRINGNVVSNPPLNPVTNVFNGTNSFNNSSTLYNMDMDFFNINDHTNLGDNSMQVSLQSLQDAVIINNMVVVLNTEVPDATIDVDPITLICDSRDLEINYRVSNIQATDVLPAATPIAFYADNTLIGQSATVNAIPINGFEDGSITISIPNAIPNNFTLEIKVDDDGTGNGIVIEFQEDNNSNTQIINLGATPLVNPFDNISICDLDGNNTEIVDLTVTGNQMLGTQTNIQIRYYLNQNDANDGNNNNIATPNAFNATNNQTIYVRMEDPMGCSIVESFTITISVAGMVTYEVENMEACTEGLSIPQIFVNLHDNLDEIYNGQPQNQILTFHLNENDALTGNNPIAEPTNYQVINNNQTIWFRLISQGENACAQYGSFDVIHNPSPLLSTTTLESCSLEGPGSFNLNLANNSIVANANQHTITYHLTINDAELGINPLPNNYTATQVPTQIIFARVLNNSGCYDKIAITLQTTINTAQLPNVYEVCDDPYFVSDGIAEFDLTTYQTQIVTALTIPNGIVSYYRTANEAELGINEIQNPTQFTNTVNPQIIYARAENPNGGCGGVAEFTLRVLEVPHFDLQETIAFCDTENDKSFTFDQPFNSYEWINEQGEIVSTSPFIDFEEPGTYTLVITQANMNCEARRDIEVIFDEAPVITNIEVNGTTISVYPYGGNSPYQYSYNNGLTWNDYFTYTDVAPGIYDMIVKSKYGCVSEPYKFGVLGIPNAITPNGDGFNDTFTIRGLEMYPDSHIRIFDRFGKIFMDRKMGTNFQWDGRYLNRPLPSGDYWYIINTTNGLKFSGHISLRNRS